MKQISLNLLITNFEHNNSPVGNAVISAHPFGAVFVLYIMNTRYGAGDRT